MIYKDDRFKILHQGIDTLVIGVNCTDEKYFDTKFSAFIHKIAMLKQQAQNLRTFGEKYVLDDLGFEYGNFKVSSKGLGQYFGYFANDDIFCTISDTKFKPKGLYHLKIQFRSVFLLKYGHIRAYEFVNKFLNDIFGVNFRVSVLRLDLATDVTGVKYTPQDFLKFRSLKRISNYSDQYKKDDDDLIIDEKSATFSDIAEINVNNFMRFTRFEGVSFGKNPHMFRVYDKIKQVQSKNISTLIFTKWEINGFNPKIDLFVFRHEAEFGRLAIKRLVPINEENEINYIFSHLGAFWSQGLSICKWYDLTDDEVNRLTAGAIQSESVRKIYQRCDLDTNRLKFWDFISTWGDDKFKALTMHDLVQSRDVKKAKMALKAFVSAVYTNLGVSGENFLYVFTETLKDLEKDGLSLHEYGLSKLAGNFLKNEKIIKNQNLDVDNPLFDVFTASLSDFFVAISQIRNDDYKRPIETALKAIK